MTAAAAGLAPAERPGLAPSGRLGNLFIWPVWIVLALAAGLRWFGRGRDFADYLAFYARLDEAVPYAQERFESGFKALAWVFKFLLDVDYPVYAIALAAATLAVKIGYFRRHTEWPVLAFIAYMGSFYPLHEYTQIRAAVSIALAMIAVERYLSGRLIQCGVFLILGALFHSQILLFGLAIGLFHTFVISRLLGFLCLAVLAYGAISIGEGGFYNFALQNSAQLTAQLTSPESLLPANPFKGVNLLQAASILAVGVLPGAPRDREQALYLFFGVLSLVLFYLFKDIAVLATRFGEMFAVFTIPMAFRAPLKSPAFAAALIAILNAAYNQIGMFETGVFG